MMQSNEHRKRDPELPRSYKEYEAICTRLGIKQLLGEDDFAPNGVAQKAIDEAVSISSLNSGEGEEEALAILGAALHLQEITDTLQTRS